jgi:hypothetical protein
VLGEHRSLPHGVPPRWGGRRSWRSSWLDRVFVTPLRPSRHTTNLHEHLHRHVHEHAGAPGRVVLDRLALRAGSSDERRRRTPTPPLSSFVNVSTVPAKNGRRPMQVAPASTALPLPAISHRYEHHTSVNTRGSAPATDTTNERATTRPLLDARRRAGSAGRARPAYQAVSAAPMYVMPPSIGREAIATASASDTGPHGRPHASPETGGGSTVNASTASVDLDELTRRVVSALDRRQVAHRERMGRC